MSPSASPIRFARRKADVESLWLITFADLMVQLMAFFALLYSFSVHDQAKMEVALKSIQKALGVQVAMAPGGEGILPGSTGMDPAKATDLEKFLSDAQSSAGADVGTRMRIVSFRGSLIFEEGSANLIHGSDAVLVHLSDLVKRYPGFTLVCEGHAAPGEKGPGMDALDISARRAQIAVRFLTGLDVDPARVTAEARGDSMPEGDGTSPEGRALQRRVVFRFQRVAER